MHCEYQFLSLFSNQEERNRRKDKQKIEGRQNEDAPGAVRQLNKSNMINPTRKRSKLVLPAPQVSEGELEEVVKMGRTSEAIAADATAGKN